MFTLQISTKEKGVDSPDDIVIKEFLMNGKKRCTQIIRRRKGDYMGKYFQCDKVLARCPTPNSDGFCSCHQIEADRNKCKNFIDCKSYTAVAEKYPAVVEEKFYSVEKQACIGYDYCGKCIVEDYNERSVEQWNENGERIVDYPTHDSTEVTTPEVEPVVVVVVLEAEFVSAVRTVATENIQEILEGKYAGCKATPMSTLEEEMAKVDMAARDAAEGKYPVEDDEEDEEDDDDSEDEVDKDETGPAINVAKRPRKSTKNCTWKMLHGVNKGECCPNKVAPGEEFCTPCLKKKSVVALDKKVSPTLGKMEQRLEKEKKQGKFDKGDIFSRREFLLQDCIPVYKLKLGKKFFPQSTLPILTKLSDHWKFIIEVITIKRGFEKELAAILMYHSDGRIKKDDNDIIWLRDEKNNPWVKANNKKIIFELDEYKKCLITKCIDMLTSLCEGKKHEEINYITQKLREALTLKVPSKTVDIFLDKLPEKSSYTEKNLLGQSFIDEVLELTNDDKFYGVTTTKLFEAREKWLKDNDYDHLLSYNNNIRLFGKIVKEHRVWEIDSSSNTTRHLGVKIKVF